VVISGRIYIPGGETTTYREPLDELLMLDTNNLGAGWQLRAPLPEPRGAMGCAAYAAKIYCSGGTVSDNGDPMPPSDDFLSYDTETNQWTTLPSMPHAREHAFAHVIGDRYYVIGGRYLGVSDTVPHTDIYDIGSGTWSLGAPPPLPRGGYASAVLQNRILIIGGELGSSAGGNADGVLERVDEYDPRRNSWRSLAPVPTPRHGFIGAVSRAADGINPVVYTITGGVSQGFSGSAVNEGFRFAACATNADCDDANPCTNDTCVSTACQHSNSSATCDDGRYCNGADVCAAGTCGHAGNPCDDHVACTANVCDESSDSCSYPAQDSRCDDDLFCNGSEVCSPANGCRPGAAPATSDGVACTVDACNETTDSVTHTPSNALCNDGLFCNGAESCNASSGCAAGTAPCVDAVACTVDACDEAANLCRFSASDAACDDGLYCSGVETCDPAQGCRNEEGAPDCSTLESACGAGVCDEASASCVTVPLNEGALCDDGLACTAGDLCSAGQCAGQSTCHPLCERCDSETSACESLCAVPHSRAGDPLASDALVILVAVTGVGTCELCLCDLDGNQQLNATDALAALRLAVSLPAPRDCPPGNAGPSMSATIPTSATLPPP
jgi:hypothetical protein